MRFATQLLVVCAALASCTLVPPAHAAAPVLPTNNITAGVAINPLTGALVGNPSTNLFPANGFPYDTRYRSVRVMADLPAVAVADVQTNYVYVSGYHTPNDGGGGYFKLTNSVASTNTGTLIASTVDTNQAWLRDYYGTINVRWFGAYGNGVTNDGPAIQAAIDAANQGETVFLPRPSNAYYSDQTLRVTKAIVLSGEQSRIRLFSFSSLFNSSGQSNLVVVDSSNARVQGLILDGNSPGNYFVTSGVSHYYSTPGYQVYLLKVGLSQSVTNVTVQDCTFTDSPFVGVSVGWYGVGQSSDVTVQKCTFIHCQGVQLTATHVNRFSVLNNSFLQPYFFNFQPYDACTGVVFQANYTYYRLAELSTNVMERFILGSGDAWGTTQIGKYNDSPAWTPVDQISVSGNTFWGGEFVAANTSGNISVKDNFSFYSPHSGIYIGTTNGPAIVSGNTVVGAVGPGIVTAGNTNMHQVIYNTLIGNHTSASDTFFGGHTTACNIWFSSDGVATTPNIMCRGNVIKQLGGYPKYGIRLDPTCDGSKLYYEGNQDYQGGASADISDPGNQFWNGYRGPFRVVGSGAQLDINDMGGSNPYMSLSRANTPYWFLLDNAGDDSFTLSGRTGPGVNVFNARQTGMKYIQYDVTQLTPSGTNVTIDCAQSLSYVTITGTTYFTATGNAKGLSPTLLIFNGTGGSLTLSYDAGWGGIVTGASDNPLLLGPNRRAVLKLFNYGSSGNATVTAQYQAQP
jgi:hypothetical protein